MTGHYLKNITPDSFSGLIFSFEGIRNSAVLLNGPTGCKFYHAAVSDDQLIRQDEFDPMNYEEPCCFGQPRVPCTYLDKRDYVYGSKDKLLDVIRFLARSQSFELLAIVNSPGASLIGDDLEAIAAQALPGVPVVTVESPGYSRQIWEGHHAACRALAEALVPARKEPAAHPGRRRVNLLGATIFHRYYEGDLAELRRLLALCGVEAGCCLCCECTVEEIRRLPEAELNLVLDPVYGLAVAEYLRERCGTPYLCAEGLPIGFQAIGELMERVCAALDCPMDAFLAESERARARCYVHLSRVNSLTGLPKGVRFAVHGTASQCLGYVRFLVGYFGMAADCVSVLERGPDFDRLRQALARYGMLGALEKDIFDTDAELVFADGNVLAMLKGKKHRFSGIEISLPTLGYTDVIPKTHLGISGGLLLCEQVINGLPF